MFKDKPWIAPGLQKSASIKSQFLSKFSKLKDHCKKTKPISDTSKKKSFINTI